MVKVKTGEERLLSVIVMQGLRCDGIQARRDGAIGAFLLTALYQSAASEQFEGVPREPQTLRIVPGDAVEPGIERLARFAGAGGNPNSRYESVGPLAPANVEASLRAGRGGT